MGTIELRFFSKLQSVMADRGFGFPQMYEIGDSLTGEELLNKLDIKQDEVEAIMLNGKVEPLSTVINAGDRVAVVPPGTPGPYRVILGIVGKKD